MLKIELIRFEAADVITSSLPIAEPTNPVVDAEPSAKPAPVVPAPGDMNTGDSDTGDINAGNTDTGDADTGDADSGIKPVSPVGPPPPQ